MSRRSRALRFDREEMKESVLADEGECDTGVGKTMKSTREDKQQRGRPESDDALMRNAQGWGRGYTLLLLH